MEISSQYPNPPALISLLEIREFLATGGDPNHSDEAQETFLHEVAKYQDSFDTVAELVKAGAHVNVTNISGQTPLHIAVMHRNRSVVNALITFGALVNIPDCRGNTVLHSAITCSTENQDSFCEDSECPHFINDMDIIEFLLKHKNIDVNARNSRGFTPLLRAVKDKRMDIRVVKALLSKGADVNIGDNFRVTPLHVAVSHVLKDFALARELLLYGACVTRLDASDRTPLGIVSKGVIGAESYAFADKFLMLVALTQKNKELISFSLQFNDELLELYTRCCEEVYRMRSEIINEKVSLYDFVTHRMKGNNIVASETEISSAIVKILMSDSYPKYFENILSCMFKYELCKVLGLTSVSRPYDKMSRLEIYKRIVALNASEKSN